MAGFEDIVSGAPKHVEPPFLEGAKARWLKKWVWDPCKKDRCDFCKNFNWWVIQLRSSLQRVLRSWAF